MVYKAQEGILKEKISKLSLFFIGMMLALTASLAVFSTASAEDNVVRVSGNTVDESAGESGSPGWWFNRDTSTSSPYEFNTDAASIGAGSLYVEPIGSNPSDKFIAENFIFTPVSEINSISYDFQIAGNGTSDDAEDFYLNVYANLPGSDSDNYYDCRFDYVPSTGSTTEFTTASFSATDTPVAVNSRGGASCPSTLAEMPEGSTVRMFSISVGDTSASDTGLAGYLDNVVLGTTSGNIIYDFDPEVQAQDDCKKGGYAAYGFRNQGLCIQYVNTGKDSRVQ